MKALKVLMCVMALALLVSPIYLAYAAEVQQTAPEKMKMEEGKMPGKTSMCSPEHMRMMLKEDADKACVVDGVLKDEMTRNMVMDKIAGDPQMRKAMMDKCMKAEKTKMPMHEGMMKEGGTMKQEGMPSTK